MNDPGLTRKLTSIYLLPDTPKPSANSVSACHSGPESVVSNNAMARNWARILGSVRQAHASATRQAQEQILPWLTLTLSGCAIGYHREEEGTMPASKEEQRDWLALSHPPQNAEVGTWPFLGLGQIELVFRAVERTSGTGPGRWAIANLVLFVAGKSDEHRILFDILESLFPFLCSGGHQSWP